MFNAWLLISICLMIFNWVTIWKQNHRLNIFSKPLPIFALAIWLATATHFSGNAIWFFIGLFVSAVGDLLLIFHRLFMWGLAAFFLAHCVYIVGFNNLFSVSGVSSFVILFMFALIWLYLFGLIRAGLMRIPNRRKMVRAVVVYSLVLCLMAFSALSTFSQSGWEPAAAALVSSGAVLFMFSDFLLAVDRFVRPLASARLWKRITYQLGQFAIAAGVALAFSEGTRFI